MQHISFLTARMYPCPTVPRLRHGRNAGTAFPTVRVYINTIVSDVTASKALREDARSDENNAFMSEDSTKVRRANKGVEKRKI